MLVYHLTERCSAPNAATALYHPETNLASRCHRSERCHCALPHSGQISLSNATRARSAVVVLLGNCRCGCQLPRHSLLRKNCIKKVVQGRNASRPLSTPFLFATTKQTTADDRPDWSETTTNSFSSSSVLPPMAVIHPQFELRRPRILLARLLRSLKI